MKQVMLAQQPHCSGDQCKPTLPMTSALILGRLFTWITDRIYRWRMLSNERYLLMTLSDELLKDIGLNRIDAMREAQRPFWDEPGRKH